MGYISVIKSCRSVSEYRKADFRTLAEASRKGIVWSKLPLRFLSVLKRYSRPYLKASSDRTMHLERSSFRCGLGSRQDTSL